MICTLIYVISLKIKKEANIHSKVYCFFSKLNYIYRIDCGGALKFHDDHFK